MKIANVGNRVRVAVLLSLSMAVTLMFVLSDITSAGAQSTATVRVSNLAEEESTQTPVGSGQGYGQALCTGDTASTLEKVRVRMNGKSGATPKMTIHTDASGKPGKRVHSLTSPTIEPPKPLSEGPMPSADFTSAGYALAASTIYWVVVTNSWPGRAFTFSTVASPDEDPDTHAGWAIGDQYLLGLGKRWIDPSRPGKRSIMRMAIYASGDTPIISSPAFPDSDCDGTVDSITFSVNENAAANTIVGTASARDLDGDSLTYSVRGTDAAAFGGTFALSASTGEITVKCGTSIDYESDRSYSITVSVTDGEDATGAAETEPTSDATVSVRIEVINLDDPGTIRMTPSALMVNREVDVHIDDPDDVAQIISVKLSRAGTATGTFTPLTATTPYPPNPDCFAANGCLHPHYSGPRQITEGHGDLLRQPERSPSQVQVPPRVQLRHPGPQPGMRFGASMMIGRWERSERSTASPTPTPMATSTRWMPGQENPSGALRSAATSVGRASPTLFRWDVGQCGHCAGR